MEVTFDSRLDKRKTILKMSLLLPLGLILVHMYLSGFSLVTQLMGLMLLVLALGLAVWQLSETFYTTDGQYLHFRSGRRRGKIEIRSIERIRKCQQWWPLGDASRSLDGFLILFRHGQLFVGPSEERAFIREIKRVNPSIQVF